MLYDSLTALALLRDVSARPGNETLVAKFVRLVEIRSLHYS